MSQLGRISGPLLKANLIRDGVDLAFETDLLYLDVNNSRIGVKTSSPSTELDVNGTIRTNDLQVINQLDIANLTLTGSTISSNQSTITLNPFGSNAVVYQGKFIVDDIQITGNTISTEISNSNLELRANGTGVIDIRSSTNITGNLDVSGNINATGNVVIGGNITIGDEITDTITINAAIKSSLIPETDNLYDLGSSSFRWKDIYVNNFFTTTLNVPELDIGNLIFRDNEISSQPGSDINITADGAQGVRLGNFRIVNNIITNVVVNSITQIQHSGTGYFKIAGTNAFVPPVGNDAQRPTAYAEVGMTRYNTNSRALEVWIGTAWANPSGASGAVSENDANEIAAIYALILG
jgi:hypothetical protein